MAWCLTAPSHYLKQCRLIIADVLWHSPMSNFMGNTQNIYLDMSLKITNVRLSTEVSEWVIKFNCLLGDSGQRDTVVDRLSTVGRCRISHDGPILSWYVVSRQAFLVPPRLTVQQFFFSDPMFFRLKLILDSGNSLKYDQPSWFSM